ARGGGRQEGGHAGRARGRRRALRRADPVRGEGQEAVQESGLERAQPGDGRPRRAVRGPVGPGEGGVPAGREPLHEYEGNKLIVAVDREPPDGLALELAYRL